MNGRTIPVTIQAINFGYCAIFTDFAGDLHELTFMDQNVDLNLLLEVIKTQVEEVLISSMIIDLPEPKTTEIPSALHKKLQYLGLLDDAVRTTHVGASNYSDHLIQPWTIWLDYPELTTWDHDIIKRILRTKSTEPRLQDYEKIKHICEERIRQIKLEDSK